MDINSIIEMIEGHKYKHLYQEQKFQQYSDIYNEACGDIIEQLRKMSDESAPEDCNKHIAESQHQKFTDEQLLDYMFNFYKENQQLPPFHVAANYFSVVTNTIFSRISKLERQGFLQKNAVNKIMFSKSYMESKAL